MPKIPYGLRQCAWCGKDMEPSNRPGQPRKYCSPECKADARVQQRQAPKSLQTDTLPPPEMIAQYAKSIADTDMDDEIRETIRSVVRDSMRQVVKDKVLQAAETMTDMLPLALMKCFEDLNSESWIERKNAYSLLMKYGFQFAEKEEDQGADLQNITVVMGGVAPAIAQAPQPIIDGVEPWENEWPQCQDCERRTHPDNFSEEDERCMTCVAKNLYYKDRDISG